MSIFVKSAQAKLKEKTNLPGGREQEDYIRKYLKGAEVSLSLMKHIGIRKEGDYDTGAVLQPDEFKRLRWLAEDLWKGTPKLTEFLQKFKHKVS